MAASRISTVIRIPKRFKFKLRLRSVENACKRELLPLELTRYVHWIAEIVLQ
jgi:hypothetical protein